MLPETFSNETLLLYALADEAGSVVQQFDTANREYCESGKMDAKRACYERMAKAADDLDDLLDRAYKINRNHPITALIDAASIRVVKCLNMRRGEIERATGRFIDGNGKYA